MLDEEYRKRLDVILGQMARKNHTRDDMSAVVTDFKSIYDPDAQLDESDFRGWYQEKSIENNLSPDPDDPRHFYNYRAAFRSGAEPDETGHWPSKFKKEGHPDLIIDGVDTRTDKSPDWGMFLNPTPYFEEFQKTALAPKRTAQVTAAPTLTEEVPVENVRTEQMQLQQPETAPRQPEIMEPMGVNPGTFLGDLAGATTASFKRMGGATGQELARKLEKPVRPVNPQWVEAGRKITEAGGPKNQQEAFYAQAYNRQLQQDELQQKVAPLANRLKQAGADLQESIPEKDRITVEGAQAYLTSDEAKKLGNLPKTIAAVLISSADQTANLAAGFAGVVPGLEGVPAFTMIAQEKQSWVDAAKNAGLDDPAMLDKYGDNYAIPSGALEYIGSAVVGAPARTLVRGAKGKAVSAAAKMVPKSVVVSSLMGAVKNIGATVGSAAFEGLTEMSQQELQNAVLYWALTDAAKNNPEKAEQYTATRDKLDLHPANRENFDSFILGFASSLPQNIAARMLGGAGKMAGRTGTTSTTVRTEEKPVAPAPAPEAGRTGGTGGTVRTENEIAAQNPEAETVRMPVVPPEGAKITKKTAGITQTYVPGEAGSIIPPQPTGRPDGTAPTPTKETENVLQEEKGRVQVAPVEKQPAVNPELIKTFTEPQTFGGVVVDPKEMDGLSELPNNTVTKAHAASVPDDHWTASIDGDFFKAINDVFGHETGDRVIKEIGLAIKKQFPDTFIGREGGEEFFVDFGTEFTPEMKEKIKAVQSDVVENLKLPDGSPFTLSIGIGRGHRVDERNQRRLASDVAAYIAKDNGRNQIAIDNGTEKDYTYIKATETGKKKYLTEFSKKQAGTYVDILRNQGDLDPATAERIRNEISGGETTEAGSGRTVSAGTAEPAARQEVTTERATGPAAPAEIEKNVAPSRQFDSLVKFALDEQAKRAKSKLHKSLAKTITVTTAKEPPANAKQLLGDEGAWEAAVWYNPESKIVEVHVNENLPVEKYAEALYHEIPGHIGQRLVFANSPAVLNSMRQMYGAAKTRKDTDLESIRSAYKKDIENAGNRGDDLLFEEWTAHNLHRYLIKNDRSSLPTRIYNLFRAALVRIGVVKEKQDDVLRSMVKKMKKVTVGEEGTTLEETGRLNRGRPDRSPQRIYDLESAKAVAQDYGLDFSGQVPAQGGPEYLFTHKKTGTQFRAKTPDEVSRAVGQLADRIAPKGTVKAGEGVRFLRPQEEGNSYRKDIKKLLNDFEDGVDLTEQDVFEQAKGISEDSNSPELSDAISAYEEALAEDQRLKGRGDMDSANEDLFRILRKISGEGIRFKRPIEEEGERATGSAAPTEKSVTPGSVNLDIDDETKREAMRRVVTDRYYRLRRIMETAEKTTGKPLPDEMNAYVKNDIINSKITDKVDTFQKEHIDRIADIAVKNNLTVEQIDDYLYAKHAPEANAVVAERRPDMVEKGIPPSGMSDEQAGRIIENAEKNGTRDALERISGIVQEWNRARLDMMVEDELITADQRDTLLKEFKNYVPLKGIAAKDGTKEKELPRTGKGYNVSRREFFMRKGRTTRAQNILAHLAEDSMEKAIRGEKNKVIQSLYKFAKEFKNDLIVTEPVAITKQWDDDTGEFKDVLKTKFAMSDMQRYGLPINFKVEGKPMQMLIKDEPLMRAMGNIGSDAGNAIVETLNKYVMPVQRYLALVRTQLSLNFIPSNALRDTMTAQINSLGLNLPEAQQKGLSLAILKAIPKSMKWAYEGQTDKDTEGGRIYKDFVKNGGAIEFFGLKDVESMQRGLVNQINGMKPGSVAATKRLFKSAYDYITVLNGSVENANRLATYHELVKRGATKQQAAYIAKNITVNFNRKGEIGSALNALYLFFNASIQGSMRLLKALKGSKTVRKVAAGAILSSLAHAELMRLIAGDDDDDKKNYYDKISDFTRDTHMVLPLGKLGGKEEKNYLRIPLPYGYNVFWAAGQHLSRVLHGGADEILPESLHMLGAIADAFNPIGGSVDLTDPKSMVRNFVPTMGQPIAELAVNQNFMGGPVYKETKGGFGPQPTAAHSRLKSTPESLVAMTAWANDITGGGKYREGAVNVSPDVINHLWEFTTGGTGKVATDMINAPFEWIANKKVPLKSLPLAQRFYGEINEYKDVKTFYDNMAKAQKIYKDYDTYRTREPEKAKELALRYPAVITMMRPKKGELIDKNLKSRNAKFVPFNQQAVKRLEQLNELRKRYDEKGDRDAVRNIEKRIVDHAQKWNGIFDRVLKPLPRRKK